VPFNGSGVYSMPSLPGSFNPATTGQQATPADWTTLTNDFVAAWNLCITRDGQSTVTANIPFGGFRLTNVGTGTAGTDAVNLTQVLALIRQVPAVKTANFTVVDTDIWLINNKAGSQCDVTLPSAAAFPGRVLNFLNYQAFAVASVAANVIGTTGGAATFGILSAIPGQFCTLVSDGTNWRKTVLGP